MSRCRPLLSAWLLLALSPLAAVAQRTPPKPIATPTPHYPAALVDSGRDGTATIEFTVDVDGSVKNPAVKSADDPAFAESALAALPGWKFTPGMKDGKPAAIKVSLPFKFNAPPEQKVNALFKRKVYFDLPEQPITAKELKDPLEPLAAPRIPYPPTHAGSGKVETVEVEFVVTPSGQTANPIALNEVEPQFAAVAVVYVASLIYAPPKHGGKPVYVQTTHSVRFAEEPEAN